MITDRISSAAKNIARIHNQRIKDGYAGEGFLVFASNGGNGTWYKESSRPKLKPGEFRFDLRTEVITEAEAQAFIDEIRG